MSFNTLYNLISIIFWVAYMMMVPRMLHIMQQESYQNDGMFRWITKNPKIAFKRGALFLLGTIAVFILLTLGLMGLINAGVISTEENAYIRFVPSLLTFLGVVITTIVFFVKDHKERKQAKKPLNYTARAKRLFVYNFFVVIILQVFFSQSFSTFYPQEVKNNMNMNYINRRLTSVYTTDTDQIIRIRNFNATRDDSKLTDSDRTVIEQVAKVEYALQHGDTSDLSEKDYEAAQKVVLIKAEEYAAYLYDTQQQVLYFPILCAFLMLTLPFNMIIANWFASPLEGHIAEKYVNKARKKLHKPEFKNLIKIGITGSYGKTSTKFILKTILEEKYKVFATPGSYNTTMGNVRVIREQLQPEHEVFISEMGARKKRDIQEICNFVEPQIGIITSIGEQHLDTFKNIENIKKAKGELLKGTALDGAVFLPKFNDYCFDLYKSDKHDNKFLYSTHNDGSDIYAKDIKASEKGSTFTIVSKKNGSYDCKTKLLGEHNVQNIVGAVAIAEYLGLNKEQIQKGIEKIEPVEHRLQLLPSTNGTIVIDDAFNSNPIGSKAALDVIKQFEGRKIIVTPGMVELGKEEANLNKEFGRQIADAVDIAILVGPKHTKPIEEGLREKGFDDMAIYVVKNLDDATKTLGRISKAGDVILFENDLPDAYNE